MVRTASITEANAQLSRLIEAVEHGETHHHQRGGRSVAVLRSYPDADMPPQLRAWAGLLIAVAPGASARCRHVRGRIRLAERDHPTRRSHGA